MVLQEVKSVLTKAHQTKAPTKKNEHQKIRAGLQVDC